MSTVRNQVNTEQLFTYLDGITSVVRLSGTPEEAASFEYIEQVLTDLGFTVNRYLSDGLIGYPATASLRLAGGDEIACNGYSLSPSTGPSGVTAVLVDLGDGTDTDFAAADIAGKIVLTSGLATPGKGLAAARGGAVGHIHDNGSHIHEMCISPIWGTPLPATADLLPTVPAVAVTGADAEILRDRLAAGPAEVTLVTEPFREWVKVPTLTADLPGAEGDDFVLFSGHVDSWHFGVMDNGTANATQLEVGRILAGMRDQLRRGLRLAFWSGHSHGRYAGSTWYAEAFWQELHDRCVCHVNVDSVGAIGASILSDAPTMAETYAFGKELLAATPGEELDYRRISRSSDQSFWGHGIPSLFAALSEQPRDDSETGSALAQLLGAGGKGGGLGWWWHTTCDTRDKIDPANFTRDAAIYTETLWQLCTLPRLPFDPAAGAAEIAAVAADYDAAAGDAFELSATVELAQSTAAAIQAVPWSTLSDASANALIRALNQTLIPVNYTQTGPFHQDLALRTDKLPGLVGAKSIASLPAGSDARYFAQAELRREQNRVNAALHAATRLAAGASA